jgi:putative endonuclease
VSIGLKRQHSGRRGERLAAWFLEQRGYRIRERNLRLGRFEVDLVAEKHGWLVFVEVKARSSTAWVRAAGSLRPAQRRRLATAASAYSARATSSGQNVRFDVITVDESEHALVIEHLWDALGDGGDLR